MTRLKILFLTNSEHGQANVMLAVAHELMQRGNIDLHFGSFSTLEFHVNSLNSINAGQEASEDSSITFHLVPGDSMTEAFAKYHVECGWIHGPGTKGSIHGFSKAVDVLVPWPDMEYIGSYNTCADIIRFVKPDLIVLDPVFSPGVDACNSIGEEFVVLSPNSFREHLGGTESLFTTIFKFPLGGTGWAYPVSLWRGCLGLMVTCVVIYNFITSSRAKSIAKTRMQHGIKTRFPFGGPAFSKDRIYLLPATPETDFPCRVPPNIISCGPIIKQSLGFSLAGSGIASFLDKRSTILVNLGTHRTTDLTFGLELAAGLKILLDARPMIQILWKFKSDKDIAAQVTNFLSKEIAEDSIRIEKWLEIEPATIVAHHNIICSIHHGGANAYNEAIAAGVPHIVLPCWFDTYQYAARVEWLGIGIYGNKAAAPNVNREEFGRALMTITNSASQKTMTRKAQDIATATSKYGGRKRAADLLAEIAEKGRRLMPESASTK